MEKIKWNKQYSCCVKKIVLISQNKQVYDELVKGLNFYVKIKLIIYNYYTGLPALGSEFNDDLKLLEYPINEGRFHS